MGLTDNSSLYGSIQEQGINIVVQHIMRQRPSLFNYGTAAVRDRPELLCAPIEATQTVRDRKNPLLTIQAPLPVLGTDGAYGLDFCAQLTRAEVDFHPNNVITLPPELAPLAEQRFAVHGTVCAGIACPDQEIIERIIPQRGPNDERPREIIVIPTARLNCFCLDFVAVGSAQITGAPGSQRLQPKLHGIEIVDIAPAGLENSLECYISLLIQLVIFPKLSVALPDLVFNLLNLATVSISATPSSPALPHNPAIEDDQLKVYINVEVS